MQKQPKITYLLGAGASANALPLVTEIPFALNHFIERFSDFDKYENSDKLNGKLEKTKKLIIEIKKHYSIDTYAKKLYLIGDDHNYNRLKNLISVLLIYYQLNEQITAKSSKIGVINLFDNSTKEENEKINKLYNKLSQNLDYRYDSFYATLLNKQHYLPDNVNIMSWNYDFQLEKAYSFYANSTKSKISSNLNIIEHSNAHLIKYNPNASNILKLNGTGLFEKRILNNYLNQGYSLAIHNLFIDALEDDTFTSATSSIKFAWETDKDEPMNPILREQAKKIIADTEILVVIGYSFPIFNREVDMEILRSFDKKIYIQAPENDAIQFKSQLESIKTGLSQNCSIQTNLNQFLIPNEFWNNHHENDGIIFV